MAELDARSFFEKYGDHYKRIFRLNEIEFKKVSAAKIVSQAKYYCLMSEQNKILAFCSFTMAGPKVFELGDVVKVAFKLRRKTFSAFLESVSDSFFMSGNSIVGFPNSKAIQLEIESGYSVVSTYVKQPGVVFFNLVWMLPIALAPRGYYFDLRLMSLFFIKHPIKVTRRKLIVSSNKHLMTRRAYLGVYIQYIKSNRPDDFPYISFKGKNTRLLKFYESDNSL